jgi:uncharacterized membrane protein YeaQ/YmgE (transglycosylase-associated protein family)
VTVKIQADMAWIFIYHLRKSLFPGFLVKFLTVYYLKHLYDITSTNVNKGDTIMVMEIITWIIVGGLAGWIASKIMRTDAEMGAMANIVVGIIGAFVGGFLVRMLTGAAPETFSIMGVIVAIIGAVVLLAIVKAATGRTAHHA